jgi:hypothetical protein
MTDESIKELLENLSQGLFVWQQGGDIMPHIINVDMWIKKNAPEYSKTPGPTEYAENPRLLTGRPTSNT